MNILNNLKRVEIVARRRKNSNLGSVSGYCKNIGSFSGHIN
jgi:hypothetical protein